MNSIEDHKVEEDTSSAAVLFATSTNTLTNGLEESAEGSSVTATAAADCPTGDNPASNVSELCSSSPFTEFCSMTNGGNCDGIGSGDGNFQLQHELKEELDSGDELPPQSEETDSAPILEIRCGLLTAKLHMRRFTCPGIHRKCVEFDGKLISPRQFTIKAEKDKQKDWKGSIRLGKHNLRTLMEMKTLDFYDHQSNCSLKCQSRNYIKNRKNENNSGGSGGELSTFANEHANKAAGSDMGEQNDIKSVASSSSAASTRKSSAVLEDYVSQTVPSMGFSAYALGGGTPEQAGRGGSEAELLQRQQQKGGQKTPQPAISSSNSSGLHLTPSTATATPQLQHHNGHHVGQSPFSSVATLNLFQQSPLKQLFGGPHQKTAAAAHHPFPAIPLSPHQLQHNHHQFPPHSNGTVSGKATAAATRPPPVVSQEAALTLLLQSVQTSILMEQQQKTAATAQQQHANGSSANSLLAQLAQLSALQPPVPPANLGLLNGNGGGGAAGGLEHLLSAAALFPTHHHAQQQQRTPVKQEPVNVANIRKSMEENASLFWSQMRNMGLLEDMLKTLSDTLERLKQIYLTGGNAVSEEFAAQRLSGVTLALDLCSLFGEKIHSRYIQATLESTLINKELLELQRKQEEQKRKLENAKRKSQVFDQLLKNGASLVNGSTASSGTGTHHHGGLESGENGAPKLKKLHLNI